MDREARKFVRWWIVAALTVAVLNLLGACAKPTKLQTAPTPQLVLSPLVTNVVSFFYWSVTEIAKLEVSFCMGGYVSEKTETALITRLIPVWIDSAGQAALWHRPATCPDSQNVIGMVHFHPPHSDQWNSCEFSDTDIIAAHWNRYLTTAIVCKAQSDSFPRMIIMFRKEFDERFSKLKPDTSRGPTPEPWKATYKYRRPP